MEIYYGGQFGGRGLETGGQAKILIKTSFIISKWMSMETIIKERIAKHFFILIYNKLLFGVDLRQVPSDKRFMFYLKAKKQYFYL